MHRNNLSSRRLALRSVCVLAFAAALLASPAPAPAAEVRTMSVEEARAAAESGSMVLVDIRTPDEWRDSGIPDVARPLDMTSKGFVRDLLALRGEDPSVSLGLICATGGRSRYLANWLARNGVRNVVDVPAGVHTRDGWLAKKLPVRRPDAARRPVKAP